MIVFIAKKLMPLLFSFCLMLGITPICAYGLPNVSADSQIEAAHDDNIEQRTLRVGYYWGDSRFQDGFSDDARKTGYGYEYLQRIAAHNNWVLEYVYGSEEEVLEQLANGEIDIVAGVDKTQQNESLFLFPDDNMGLKGQDVYVVLAEKDSDILEDLNEAQAHVLEISPDFEIDLNEKYYPVKDSDFTLSAHQIEWLSNKESLNIGYLKGSLPISGQSEEGNPEGIIQLLIQELSEKLEIPINSIAIDSIDKMYDALYADEVDATFPVFSDLWTAESKHTVQTETVISERAMIIYYGDYREDLTDKVGVYKDGPNQKIYVEMNYPNAEVIEYESRRKALDAVLSGEVNCVIGCSSIMQNYLAVHADEFDSLSSAILPDNENFSMAVRSTDGVFAGILNSVIMTIDDEEFTNALIRYSANTQSYSLASFISHNAISVVTILLVLVIIGLFVFLSFYRRTQIFNQEQEKSQRMLESALDAANAANNAKTTFLSNMSHDIRTPMNGIIGMTAIAKANLDNPEKVSDSLDKISVSSKHLLNLINDILDMSKIESGEIALNEEIVDLSVLMSDLVTLNKPLADAKNHHLIMRVLGIEHEKVIGDPLRIQQLLTNLISNSIKYTPEGGQIEMTLEEIPSIDPKRACYKFIITDNGIGMEKDFLPRLFDPFQRAESTDNRTGEQGTGLGMAIVQNILQLMGGDIAVDSEVNVGTTFTVTLYLKPEDETDLDYDNLRGKRILVVDDDQSVCESVCLLLDEMGVKGEWVLSGEEALKKVESAAHTNEDSNDYHAVFIDWKMPGMDGVATTKAIREHLGSDVPLIIISAYDWSDIEHEAIDAGANGFISKPLFKSRLVYLFESIEADKNPKPTDDADVASTSIDFTGMKALLVEDNALNGQVALEILGASGMEFDWAHNGQEAVDMFKESPEGYYSCVLMDIQMPVMNGLEASRVIRSLDRPDAASVPIFAMTADAFTEDKQAALDAGMNEHFAKPLDFDVVFETIGKYLNDDRDE